MRKRKATKPPPLKDPSEIADEELGPAYRAFCERAKSWPDAKRRAGHLKFQAAFDRRRANDLRHSCDLFSFWLACPDKSCRRNRSCSGDATACHDRFWPLVPERLKFEYRGMISALNDGLSPQEAACKVKADWERMEALARDMGQGPAAEPANARAPAMPAMRRENAGTPPSPPERPRGPRVRML